ncbi:MAG: HPF/RaiA family ribosome-associated protein [Bacteroidales bacterium]
MEIKIHAVKFKVDSKLEELIEKKVEKLGVFMPSAFKAEVTLKVDADQKVSNKITEVRLNVPGYDLFATKRYDSFEEGVDDCVNALKKQIEKAKDNK